MSEDKKSKIPNRPSKGVFQDVSLSEQPKNTVRFALNSVTNTNEGDKGTRTNEEGNQAITQFPIGYTPIGKEYMSGGEAVVFLAKDDNTASEIGILKADSQYETHVNDSLQTDKLGFNVTNQIDCTYRLRRGCERTIYFVEKGNKPRYYNFDKPEDFKTSGNWDSDKFNLFKTTDETPVFENIEILETGALPAGSYNFAFQYLDEDLNPTEWISTTDTVIIYNDSATSRPFSEIRGSTNKQNFYQDFGTTNKAIRLTLTNLNTDFPFYRIGVIEANNGSGNVNRVIFSLEISTEISTYTYTGQNAFSEGTEEEILQLRNSIDSAESIEQIENRLILGKTKGKQVNWCKLQKYASRITAELVTEEIVLNNVNIPNNPKRGQLHTEKLGYMPGEIYSFAIVYEFDDGYLSPAFHIPGRAEGFPSQMSLNNELDDTFYTDNTCGIEDYWGSDSQGNDLLGQKVRHHRFPLRSEVNKPLYTKISGALDGTQTPFYTFYLDVYNDVLTNSSELAQPVEYVVTYEIDSVQSTATGTITSVPEEGIQDILIVQSAEPITFISVQEIEDGVASPIYSGLRYEADIRTDSSVIEDAEYRSEIFGIQFSNIDLPGAEAVGKEKIVGYYIVRNPRTEDEKTILDTAVLTPLVTEKDGTGPEKYVATGLVAPNTTRIKEDVLAIIHPEHKFNNNEYTNTTEIIKEGVFNVDSTNYTSIKVQDVMPGTSYDSSVNKRRERDSDGFDLNNYIRNTNVTFAPISDTFAEQSDIKEIFYLDALFNKVVTDVNTERKDIFNIACDNKIGILQLNSAYDSDELNGKFPYVVLKRNISTSYSGFRVLPYYKEHVNPQIFSTATENTSNAIYNGDSYISSMKYVSTVHYGIVLRKRATKSGLWNFVLGALLIVVGIIASIFTGGASLALVASGITAIGVGAALINAGLTKEQIGRVYSELYELGLQDTADDDDTAAYFAGNPEDDQVRWVQDSITDLWFESNVNINWRMGATAGITDFLNSPKGYNVSQFQTYSVEKVTDLDPEADGGRTSLLYAKAEIYNLNNDYKRRDRQKQFYHLGIEYDCCTDCLEDFPGRWHWSEQSFQEELTDNYRIFLPNNYRDIEGETGTITDIFRIQNNIYIHTQEALWHLPQSIQERITGEVLSFIGTGEFFSIPPRKIVDDDTGHSAGSRHKWSRVKTPSGVFFVCESQGAIFQFTGESLKPISSLGLFNYFKDNIPIIADGDFYSVNYSAYPFRDNPSNFFGTGFISTYDSRKERVIFTKKDFDFTQSEITSSTDYQLCTNNNQLTIFEDYQATIDAQALDDWEFVGISDEDGPCKMKFQKVGTDTKEIQVQVPLPNTADIVIHLDMSSSFDNDARQSIRDAAIAWKATYGATNPEWTGNLYFMEPTGDSERYLLGLQWALAYNGLKDTAGDPVTSGLSQDIVLVSFINEHSGSYHPTGIATTIPSPGAQFDPDMDIFINDHANHLLAGGTFKGLLYPIVFTENASATYSDDTYGFLQHVLGAFKASYSTEDITAISTYPNPFVTNWDDLITSLSNPNPYPGVNYAVGNYGWKAVYNRGWDDNGAPVITSSQFEVDINAFLKATSVTETVEVTYTTVEYQYIEGTLIEEPERLDASFTMSYSLEDKSWIGWHSFLPSFYLHTPNNFYSWKNDGGTIIVGDNFVENGTFDDATGWGVSPTVCTIEDGVAKVSWGGGSVINVLYQLNVPLVIGNTYRLTYTILNYNSGYPVMTSGEGYPAMATANGTYTIDFVAINTIFGVSIDNPGPHDFQLDNIIIQEITEEPNNLWKHNIKGFYQNYYGTRYPFIVEYVSLRHPVITGIWDFVKYITHASKYNSTFKEFVEERFITFNKAVFYNSRQTTGMLTLKVKDTAANPEDYLSQQVVDNGASVVIIDKNEKDWTINDIRDYRSNLAEPIWDSSLSSVQSEYYIDKVVNLASLDADKNIYELESMRDKYLVIRLIFDNFDDVKLTFNYSMEDEKISLR